MASRARGTAEEVADSYGQLPSVGTWLGSRGGDGEETSQSQEASSVFTQLLNRVAQLESRVEALFSGHTQSHEQWQSALSTFRGVQEDLAAKVERVAVQLEQTVVPKLTESQADLSSQVKEVRTALSTWMQSSGGGECSPDSSTIGIEAMKEDLLRVKEGLASTTSFKEQLEALQQSQQQLDGQLKMSVKDCASFASRLQQLEDVASDAPSQGPGQPAAGDDSGSVQALEQRLLKELADSQEVLRKEVLQSVHEEYDKLISGLVEPAEDVGLPAAEDSAGETSSDTASGRLWHSIHADGTGGSRNAAASKWQTVPARSRQTAFDGLYDALVIP